MRPARLYNANCFCASAYVRAAKPASLKSALVLPDAQKTRDSLPLWRASRRHSSNSSQHRLKFVAGIKSLTGQRIGTNKLTTMFTKRMKETPFLGVLRVLRSEQCRARPAHAVSEPPYLLIAAVEDLGSDGGQEFVDDHAFAPG